MQYTYWMSHGNPELSTPSSPVYSAYQSLFQLAECGGVRESLKEMQNSCYFLIVAGPSGPGSSGKRAGSCVSHPHPHPEMRRRPLAPCGCQEILSGKLKWRNIQFRASPSFHQEYQKILINFYRTLYTTREKHTFLLSTNRIVVWCILCSLPFYRTVGPSGNSGKRKGYNKPSEAERESRSASGLQ